MDSFSFAVLDEPSSPFDPVASPSVVGTIEQPFTRMSANDPTSHSGLSKPGSKILTSIKRKSSMHEEGTAITAKGKQKAGPSDTDGLTGDVARKKRKTSGKGIASKQIPRSFDECSPEDQELIRMRDAGAEWKAIRAKWEEMTGEATGKSTLPNRYTRLKSNFTVIKEEDQARLIDAKRMVEEAFEREKWTLVAQAVLEKGGDSYAGVVLQRQYKKLMLSAGAQPPPGVRDLDFEIDLPEEDGDEE